jgi:thiosulfate/3-mercaptopyruvate sulfurtransferase
MDGPMDMNGKLMLEMLPPDVLRARLERLGISTHSHVVVYGVSDRISPTTRIAYTLRYAGLGSSTSLMDGGLNAWTAEGHPVAHGAPEPVKSGTLAARAEPSLVVDAAWVQAHASHPGIALLDARQVGFYDGTQQDDGPRRGHIPGAKSLPFEDLYDAQGRLRSPAELTARFHQAGVTQGDTVVAYCHIGQRATAVLLAAETLGYPVRLYDGSFQEWGRRSDLPVEGGQ